jgi:hypothetical protein
MGKALDRRCAGTDQAAGGVMKMAMTGYGEYSSAREAARAGEKSWSQVSLTALELGGEERTVALMDWWQLIDLEELACKVVWKAYLRGETDDLWFLNKPLWKLTLNDALLASNDTLVLPSLAVHWARIHDSPAACDLRHAFSIMRADDRAHIQEALLPPVPPSRSRRPLWTPLRLKHPHQKIKSTATCGKIYSFLRCGNLSGG